MNIQEIIQKLTQADHDYYVLGQPNMPDHQYDSLRDELAKLDPENEYLKSCGAHYSQGKILEEVHHDIPMGSQNKAANEQEFQDWIRNTLKLPIDTLINVSYKIDGNSISAKYKNGRLTQVATRGKNDNLGSDITANAILFQNLPKKGVQYNGQLFTGTVRAEAYLPISNYLELCPEDDSNPRNMGTGISQRKDGQDAEHIHTFAFELHGENIDFKTEEEQMQILEKMGFTVSPNITLPLSEIWEYREKMAKEKASLNYWIDGIVAKVNDIALQKSFGVTNYRPKGQIAIKFVAERAQTKIIGVKQTVGHTGAITPTALIEPVTLGGTTVSRANLANWSLIQNLNIAIGDTITVYKAGEIIPKVDEVIERPTDRQPIPEPTHCPVCGEPVTKKTNANGTLSENCFCTNPKCPAIVFRKLLHFVQVLEIEGLGPTILQALIDNGILKENHQIFELHQHKHILPNLPFSESGTRLGAKRTEKLLEEIENKKSLTLPIFLAAFGIQGLGRRRVQIIQETAKQKNLPIDFTKAGHWLSPAIRIYKNELGIPNLADIISAEIQTKKETITNTLPFITFKTEEVKVVNTNPNAKVFCITGKTNKTRNELAEIITNAGHIFSPEMSKKVQYLVIADPNSTSNKAKKAREAGVTLISEEQLETELKK